MELNKATYPPFKILGDTGFIVILIESREGLGEEEVTSSERGDKTLDR